MEKFIRNCDKEYMKMAMLKHEETFRQQVHELHHLYRVQKLLMRDMKKSRELQRQSSNSPQNQSKPRRALHLELPADEYIVTTEEDAMLENEEENELELTLAIGSSRKKREGTPYASDSGASFSSSSTESAGLIGHEWGLVQVPDVSNSFQYQKTRPFVAEGMRQDGLKQPPWLYQCLSLKMT
ncbi:uncharacterized protein [Typha latifolia]|uniref:uncharacterized protein n=1 Tax=Typha latifolia TaxID=4733 RepID=UPI003C2CD3F5